MKVLVDTCAGRRIAGYLREQGHVVEYAGDWEKDPGDETILETATHNAMAVVTRDKDFGTLAVRDKRPHCGIITYIPQIRRTISMLYNMLYKNYAYNIFGTESSLSTSFCTGVSFGAKV